MDDGGIQFAPGLSALGYVHLAIAVVGAVLLVRRHVWLGLALLLSGWAASGPVIAHPWGMIANKPWILAVEHLEILRRWWWPGRAIALLHLVVAPSLALILERIGGWKAAVAGLGALALVVAPLRADSLFPLRAWNAEVPAGIACLASAPRGAVIDLPLLVDQKNLWWQTLHHQPILGGMMLKKSAFAPQKFTAIQVENPLMADLIAIGRREYTRAVGSASPADRASLTDLGYRYVLVRVDSFGRHRVNRGGEKTWISEWSRPRRQLVTLLGAPGWEDEAHAIWRLDGAPIRCAGQ